MEEDDHKKKKIKNPVFVSKTAQQDVQIKSRNESFGFFGFETYKVRFFNEFGRSVC